LKYIIQKQAKGWPNHIVLDEKTVKKILVGDNKRAIATEKSSGESFHCAIIKHKDIGYHAYVNAALCKKLKLTVGNEIDVSFEIDNTAYQFELPEEMKEVLLQDAEAKKYLIALPMVKSVAYCI
jgi:hypothetical protein